MRKTAALLSRKVFRPSVLGQLLRDAFERIARPVSVRRAAPERRKGYMLEAIEPRLLLSADISYAVSTAHEFTLKAVGANAINLYETGTSNVAGSATLSSAGDVNVNIARGLPLGGDAAVSDTIHIDLGTLSLLDGFVNANGSKLSIDFAGGDQYAAADHVTLDTAAASSVDFGLSIKSNSGITSDANFSVTGSNNDLAITSEQAAPTPPASDITAGLFDDLHASIVLTGANLSAAGALNLTAHSDVSVTTTGVGMSAISGALINSFSDATIDIAGSSVLQGHDINLTSNVDGTLNATASDATVKLVTVFG
ncbi:MAG: LEPR-XLL domain-containing protein, partial [Burkholderiales bacterium]